MSMLLILILLLVVNCKLGLRQEAAPINMTYLEQMTQHSITYTRESKVP